MRWSWATMRWTLRGVSLAVALTATLGVPGVRGLGHWLIVSDALVPARAIVVLKGHIPFRATEAAAIYRQGWAPEIWLTRTMADEASAALVRPGSTPGTQDYLNRQVLGRFQVPAHAIRILSANIRNTADEVRLVAAELQRTGGDAVIIVTSKYHTRRVRATWRAIVGGRPAVVVRPASTDPFKGDWWWRDTGETRLVSHEVFGLLNVWARFPLGSDRK